jgi:kynurenine formamidase
MALYKKLFKVTDLSHPMVNGMPVFPGSDQIVMESVANSSSDGYNELKLEITGHTGTHLDCALHMFDNGFDCESAAPAQFIGPGIVIDCRDCARIITRRVILPYQKRIKKAEFVLLYTGWDQLWGNPRYFEDFPVLEEEAADFLTGFNLKGIGVDAPSFDPVHSSALPVHHYILSKGILLIENLTCLDKIADCRFVFSCFPLKIQKGDGSPVRAVAIQ